MQNFWNKFKDSLFSQKETPTPERPILSVHAIALRKSQALFLPANRWRDKAVQSRLQMEAMNLGFMFNEQAINALAAQPEQQQVVFGILQQLVGADKTWEPMYPNFPAQVFEMDEVELYLNAIIHYWSYGQWKPQYTKDTRLPRFHQSSFKIIGLLSENEFMGIFTQILSANSSLPQMDKDILWSYLAHFEQDVLFERMPEVIPFKETLCQLVADSMSCDYPELAALGVKTSTDILRVATRWSGGDISLAENTKFRLTRAQRRWIVNQLEPVINASDLVRHRKKWKRLFHCLHVGIFKHIPKTQALAQQIRQGKIETDRSQVEAMLRSGKLEQLLPILQQKPGEFARRLDHLLRGFGQPQLVLNQFKSIVSAVDTRVLLQLLGHFNYRLQVSKKHDGQPHAFLRVAIPKGQIALVKVLRQIIPAISVELIQEVLDTIEKTLSQRFSSLPSLGRVWIDPQLKKAPIPLQMRTAPEGLKVMQRGTRLPLSKDPILRFFVHWIGEDIDLSACFLTSDMVFHSAITYYGLKCTTGYRAVHSGDITHAPPPKGACEFIDIDLDSITDPSIRYIGLDVRVYSGQEFPLQQANVGWMLRQKDGQQGEIFDAQTVEQRIAIGASARSCMVAFFDIQEREVIWLDLLGSSHYLMGGNNVASNRYNIEELLEAAIHFKTASLYDLFAMHARARGSLVSSASEAETIFSPEMVFNYLEVMAEYMK